MKAFFRKIFSSKILCFALLFIEFLVVVIFWAIIEFGFTESVAGGLPLDQREFIGKLLTIIFYTLRGILYVINIVVFFKIVNREENPEYKIPWLVFIFILPVWTITFFLIFGKTKLRKKDVKIVEPTKKLLEDRAKIHEEENQAVLSEIDEEYQGVFNYLRWATKLDITKNNRITYYKNGEEFFPDMVEALKTAKKFIFIEFFIVARGKWWDKIHEVLVQKAKEGVEVRLIYDDIGSSKVVPTNFDLHLQKEGIGCHKFHPVMPTMSNAVNNRDHRKIVVIDHKIGFTGGMNLADEYANDLPRFGYWKDTMVKVEGKAISNLIATFLQNYDLTTFKLSDYEKYVLGDYDTFDDKGYAFHFGDAPGGYQNFEQIGEQNYINLLNVAKKKVYISTPYLIATYPLTRALQAAAKRGVEVHLIVPGIPDKKMVYTMAKCSFHTFLEAGIHVHIYTPGFNHEKQMLVDDRLCFVGTINFDFRSLTHHFETGITFLDAPCLPQIKEDFEDMLKQSEEVPVDFKAKLGQRLLFAIVKMIRVLF